MRAATVRCGSTAIDARQARERVPRRVAARLDEGDGDVLPLGLPELRQDQAIDRVVEDEADHQDGHGERDAEDRRRGAERMAHDVAQHHAPGGAEVLRDERRLEQRCAGSAPALPAASLRPVARATARRTALNAPAPAATSVSVVAPTTTRGGHAEEQHREAEEVVVEADEQRPEPRAEDDAEDDAGERRWPAPT